MSKKIINFLMLITLGLIPFFVHFMLDIFMSVEIEYINYFPELIFFNLFIFANNIMSYFNRKHSSHKEIDTILLVTYISGFILSIFMYSFTFFKNLVDLKFTNNFLVQSIILALIGSIFKLLAEIIFYVDDNLSFSEDNRYERYLLERINEKSNSIKNPQSENNEEESNNTINSEELLNGSDILEEMLKNHKEIQEYFQISKNQSKFSFYFSISSSVVGIIVVILAASGIVIFKSLGISIIAAVSGAITEIVSGIVLWIHNKSALQLNYYYDSLHENEKFLSAVNIADKLSKEKKEDMYIEIIRKQIDIQSKDKMNKASDTDRK